MSENTLIQWFLAQHGSLDVSSMSITDFPAHGRGAVALRDIPEGHVLFSIPRDLTLSTRTSTLPACIGKKAWKQFGLHVGWSGLILCMMWEEAQGPSSKWSAYLSTLPSSFDTPMFWDENDLRELHATAVVDKIGKEDAERDYVQKVIPLIGSRPDLFKAETISKHYTVGRYHIMGSRILSRSFHVEPWGSEDGRDHDSGEYREDAEADAPSMEIDPDTGSAGDASEGTDPGQGEGLVAEVEEDEDDEDDEAENPADVAMVPMADMLNARYGSENAKLFYEEHVLNMVTTKPIRAGEQIWNTYGDPPNSDLLRRYGHVDVVPLSPPLSGEGNPSDIVEVRADLLVSVASKKIVDDLKERVDWWLEECDDDTFVIGTDCELPDELLSFARLLFLPKDEWDKARNKSKLPKPKPDVQVLSFCEEVLLQRIAEYTTSIEHDESMPAPENIQSLSLNKKHAIIVRLGEKRILRGALLMVKQTQDKLHASSAGSKDRKRGRDNQGAEASMQKKKAKR